MPDLPRAGAAVYLSELALVPGLRDWIEGRDIEIRDFTTLGALQGDTWRGLAARVKAEFAGHQGRIGLHGPFLGFAIDQPDPELRAVVQDRMLTALAALDVFCAGRQGHMVLHSPFTTWSGFNRGTEMDDQAGMVCRTLDCLAPVVKRAEDTGITLVIENCEDRDPRERVDLVRAFNSPRSASRWTPAMRITPMAPPPPLRLTPMSGRRAICWTMSTCRMRMAWPTATGRLAAARSGGTGCSWRCGRGQRCQG
ncbi:hypothetical protein MASR1M32_20980 [Rhodobacter sp.]